MPVDYFVKGLNDSFYQQPQSKQVEQLAQEKSADQLVAVLAKVANQPATQREQEVRAYRRQKKKARLLLDKLVKAGAPIKISNVDESITLESIEKNFEKSFPQELAKRDLTQERIRHWKTLLDSRAPGMVDKVADAVIDREKGKPLPDGLLQQIPQELRQTAIHIKEGADAVSGKAIDSFKISPAEFKNADKFLWNAVNKKYLHQFEPLLKAGANPDFKNKQGWGLATIAASEGDTEALKKLEASGQYNDYPRLVQDFAQTMLEKENSFKNKKDKYHYLGKLAGFKHAQD